MFSLIRNYRKLDPHILAFAAAEFFVQLVNTAFFHVLLVFMEKEGYSDHESAGFMSFRFLGVLLLAFPLGLYIRGRKLKPFFIASSVIVPVLTLLIVYAIMNHQRFILAPLMALWGIGFLFYQVCALPYILRNAAIHFRTEAIALSFATYSFGGIASGMIIGFMRSTFPWLGEGYVLALIALLSISGFFIVLRIRKQEYVPVVKSDIQSIGAYDWSLVLRALVPTLAISTGAGLTIPFISIFFYNVHGMGSETFPYFGALAAFLVALAALYVPEIKRKFTYRIAIPLTQSVAVLALVLLATTQLYAHLAFASALAVICYLIRQPLMNIAGPMTSEVVMNYVGERNREIMSALTSAAWSGSWFISSWIFKFLRKAGLDYVYVFLITAVLYGLGVIWYIFLVRESERTSRNIIPASAGPDENQPARARDQR